MITDVEHLFVDLLAFLCTLWRNVCSGLFSILKNQIIYMSFAVELHEFLAWFGY